MKKHYILIPVLLVSFLLTASGQVSVFGKISGKQGVKITLSGTVNTTIVPMDCKYAIPGIPKGSNIQVSAISNFPNGTNPLGGLNTLDIVYITNHIVGKNKLTTPYKVLAADVNADKKITVADLVIIRNLILHNISDFPISDNTKYVFAKMPVQGDPSQDIISSNVKLTNLQADQEVNIVGFRMGDVTENIAPCNQATNELEKRSNEVFNLKAKNQSYKKGDLVALSVSGEGLNTLQAFQFSLNFNTKNLEYVGVESNQENISNENFAKPIPNEGIITASIMLPEKLVSDGLFQLNFIAKQDGQLNDNITLSSELTPAEAYNQLDETLDLKLQFEELDLVTNVPVLKQNEPNPFNINTLVSFTMPTTEEASFSVFNSDGKTIMATKALYTKGLNKISLQREDFPAPGIYFYQLKTKDFVGTKKMMMIK